MPTARASRRRLPILEGVEAVAFDGYGTIFDYSEADFIATFAELLALQALEADAASLWRHFLQAARRLRSENHRQPAYLRFSEAWARQFEESFRRLGLRGDAQAAALFLRDRLAQASVHPEVPQVLAALAPRYRLALLSNADDDFLLAALERNGLHFDVIVTSERAGALKPDPRIFRALLDRLGLPPAAVLYVGDNPLPDVLGARRAGLRVAWLDREGRRRPRGVPAPDLKVRSLRELLPALGLGHG
ncbi:MAG TPA: HAD family hydrolase [Dehalococcoidia bacterium]|nr:HAD family hydrolase [Dehalococcoidia bacterium]